MKKKKPEEEEESEYDRAMAERNRRERVKRPNMSTALRATFAACLVAATARRSPPARPSAPLPREIEKTFSAALPERIDDVAVVESYQTIYVACNRGLLQRQKVIEKYDFDGNPVPFCAKKPYLNGNKIFKNPGSEEGTIGRIAVDSTGGPNNG